MANKSVKKIIKNESEFKKWVIENYEKLGYSGIVRRDIGICPDLILLKNGKEKRIELETVASNFIMHKHSIDDVDEIVCIVNDVGLEKPVIVAEDLEFEGNSNRKVTLSLDSKTYDEFRQYCEDNAIMLSKKIEIWINEFMQENKKQKGEKK